jgi:hypothetical protein
MPPKRTVRVGPGTEEHPLDEEEEVDDEDEVDDEEVDDEDEVDEDEDVDDDEVDEDDGPPVEDEEASVEEVPGGGSTTTFPHAATVATPISKLHFMRCSMARRAVRAQGRGAVALARST